MRRFIAYLSIAISSLLMVGMTFSSSFIQSKTNIEYTDGKALVYRMSNEEDKEITEEETLKMASIMEGRLQTAEISHYDVMTIGNDTIKVVLSQENEENYNQIKTFLSFNGEFALGTSTDVIAVGDEFMSEEKAHVSFIKDYPTVVIPVNHDSNEFKAVIEEAKKLNDESGGDEEDEEAKTFVYLAYNWVEEDRFSEMIEGSEDYDAKKAEKLLIRFDITQIWFDDTETSIATAVEIDLDGDGSYSYTDIKNGTHKAKYYCNLINAESLDHTVTFMYEKTVPSYFEDLISYDMKAGVAWSRTFFAVLIGIVIISLLLAVFYRWGAVAISTFSIGSVFLALLFSLIFSVELTISGIIGYIAVAIVSLVSGIIYMTKVKEESYHGRSLKKANAEGSKKSLLPIVDFHVVLILLGAVAYWLGGASMVSFAAVAVFGGLASLLLNTLGLKGMMWLLTNTTNFIGKYEVIGVESKKVPNLINEEKQEYFGPFQDKDFTKKKKPIGIVAAVLFVVSLVGMITFGAVYGHLFNHGSSNLENSYIYFETNAKNTVIDSSYVIGLLDNTYYYKDGTESEPVLISYELDTVYTRVDLEEDIEVTYTYFVATLNSSYQEDIEGYIEYKGIKVEGTFETIFSEYFELQEDDTVATASFKVGRTVTGNIPNPGPIIAVVAVAVSFAMVYFLLRYRLSRGFTSIIITALTGAIALGFFVLTRIVANEMIILALPLIALVSMIMNIIFMNKDREMAKDDYVRSKDNSYERRNEIMVKATSLSFGPILITTILAGYLAIDFFGFGPSATSLIFLLALLGIIISALLVTTLYGPLSQLFFKWFSKVNINVSKPKKKKKASPKAKKSAEPEEAIFIGIND